MWWASLLNVELNRRTIKSTGVGKLIFPSKNGKQNALGSVRSDLFRPRVECPRAWFSLSNVSIFLLEVGRRMGM